MKNLKKRILVTVLTLSIFCSFCITSFAATKGVKWNSVPVTIYATNQMSNYEIEQLKQAIGVWNNTRVGTVLKYGGVKSFIRMPGEDGVNTVGKMKFSNNSLATTNLTILDGTRIIEGDIVLNSNITYGNGSAYNLKSVFIHELGHFLGLADCSDMNSVMYHDYTGRTTLSAGDINDLDSLY